MRLVFFGSYHFCCDLPKFYILVQYTPTWVVSWEISKLSKLMCILNLDSQCAVDPIMNIIKSKNDNSVEVHIYGVTTTQWNLPAVYLRDSSALLIAKTPLACLPNDKRQR